MKRVRSLLMLAALAFCAGCAPQQEETADANMPVEPPMDAAADASSDLSGTIEIDGSSTVFPITEAVAEEFQKANPNVRVTVGVSGTGGGFKRFGADETAISDASRPIKDSEAELAAGNHVEWIELPVAFDGMAVMVNPANTFVECMTVEQLKQVWEPGSTVKTWQDVDPAWPAEEMKLYAPGTDSGTFDYFTDAVNGEEGAMRTDFTPSEDDNVLVQGIAADQYALGFFGYAYYAENTDKLKLLGIDGGNGCVLPNEQTIGDGTYQPLSRPIFIYVAKSAAERPEVDAFVKFYLDHAPQLVAEVGYVPLPQAAYDAIKARYHERKTGSVFSGGSQTGVKIEDILAKE